MGFHGRQRTRKVFQGDKLGCRGFQAAKNGALKDRALENLAARRDLREENEKRRDAGRVSPALAKKLAENCFPPASYPRKSALPQAAMNAPRQNCVKATRM
jgi:hypothetical protein